MSNLNVEAIVKQYLIKNGYDGLCDSDCGCSVDLLMPCGMVDFRCQAGYKRLCKNCPNEANCESDAREGGECFSLEKQDG